MKLKRILGLAFFLCAMVAAVEAQALDEIRPGQDGRTGKESTSMPTGAACCSMKASIIGMARTGLHAGLPPK